MPPWTNTVIAWNWMVAQWAGLPPGQAGAGMSGPNEVLRVSIPDSVSLGSALRTPVTLMIPPPARSIVISLGWALEKRPTSLADAGALIREHDNQPQRDRSTHGESISHGRVLAAEFPATALHSDQVARPPSGTLPVNSGMYTRAGADTTKRGIATDPYHNSLARPDDPL
jgi:hypothetical protein